MKIVDKILARFGYSKDIWVKDTRTRDPRFGIAQLNLGNTDLDNPYSQHTWVYACIRRIAINIAGVPLRIYQGDMDNPKVVENGELYNIFRKPNDSWTKYHLVEALVTHMSRCGNALMILDRERPQAVPREIWVFDNKKFKPMIENNQLLAWKWRRTSTKEILLAPHQVLLFKYFGVADEFWGFGPLQVAMESAAQDHLASRFNRAFFENGAHIGGVLTFKRNLGPTQREQIYRSFNDKFGGAGNAFKTHMVEGDGEYKQLELSHKDMCFLEQKKWSRDEICAVFGVPKAELSVYEDINYATARSADKSFWQKTLIPIIKLIEATFDAFFFDKLDNQRTRLRFDLSVIEALQEDFNEKVKTAKVLFDMGVPFNQINQRLDMGIEDIPSGDMGFLPMGLVEAGTEPAIAPPDALQDDDDEDAKSIVHVKDGTPHTARQATYWKEYVRSLVGMERRFNESVRHYLARVKKWYTEELAKYGTVEGLPVSVIRLTDKWDDELRDLAATHYEKIAKNYGPVIESHLAQAGVTFHFSRTDPRYVDFLRVKTNKIVGINDRLRKAVQDGLAEGASQNLTIGELQNKVSDIMGATKMRSLRIARTETAGAANGLEYIAERQAGIKEHMWIAALDEVTRESHLLAMSNGPIPIGDIFQPTGLRYPGDETGPPEEIINCRCSLMATSR